MYDIEDLYTSTPSLWGPQWQKYMYYDEKHGSVTFEGEKGWQTAIPTSIMKL